MAKAKSPKKEVKKQKTDVTNRKSAATKSSRSMSESPSDDLVGGRPDDRNPPPKKP